MSSSRGSSSRMDEGRSLSSRLGESASAPYTPAPSHRRRANKQLSAKQLDKIVKNLTAVQRSVGHLRSESFSSLGNIGELPKEVDPDDIVLGEEGQRQYAFSKGAEEGEEEDAAYTKIYHEGDGMQEVVDLAGELSVQEETEIWLRRQGVDKALVQGLGKGPDGIALAKVAARRLNGCQTALPDSFLHEASFVFNPLTRRVPQPSPRKQMATPASRKIGSAKGIGGFKPDVRLAVVPEQNTTKRSASPRQSIPGSTNGSAKPAAATAAESVTDETGDPIALQQAPKAIQEALILEDLIYVLSGIEGQYIHYASQYTPEDQASRLRGATFVIDTSLDPSLRGLVEKILPLATYYTAIFAFIEAESSLEFGTVMHALCAGVRDILKEYQSLLVQLEHQMATSLTFTLQKLWFFVHPTMRSLHFLHAFTSKIAAISHANILESDDEDDEDDEEDEEDDEGTRSRSSNDGEEGDDSAQSLERKKRALFALEEGEEDGIVGGIVKGGEVIAMLWEQVINMGGDETAKKLFLSLLHSASQPYARILLKWINTGHLSDTYEEFLIMENPKVTRASLESDPTDEYWERRYMLRDESLLAQKEHERQQGLDLDSLVDDANSRGILTGGAKIPSFLEPWKKKILMAGKYLNVIRECGKDMTQLNMASDEGLADSHVVMTDESFFEQVEQAYQRANAALLDLLLNEHSIVPRLRSMKHYFFQSSADFFSSFLEAAGRELNKEVVAGKVRDVTLMRLQSHLGMVLGSSNCVGYSDPYREDVRIQLATVNAYDHLKRIAEIRGGMDEARAQAKMAKQREKERVPLMDLLQFDLKVKFPVSLVISKKNILRWQFLQRIIIHLKAVESSLCEVWMEHREPDWRRLEKGHPALQQWKMRILKLRHRILFFVQQVLAFITEEVLEPNWRELEVKMERATTVDQFLKDHFDFLNTCRKECMLIDYRYLELMSKLMSTAQVFCDTRAHFRSQLAQERTAWLQATAKDEPPTMSAEVSAYLNKIEGSWERRLGTFKDIVALLSTTDNDAAKPLSYRLQSA